MPLIAFRHEITPNERHPITVDCALRQSLLGGDVTIVSVKALNAAGANVSSTYLIGSAVVSGTNVTQYIGGFSDGDIIEIEFLIQIGNSSSRHEAVVIVTCSDLGHA